MSCAARVEAGAEARTGKVRFLKSEDSGISSEEAETPENPSTLFLGFTETFHGGDN